MDFDARGKAAGATSIKGTWREALGLDYRSLALYRLLIGIVIVYDMLDRWDDTYAWYSDQGILSRENLLSDFWDPSYVSVHMVNGSTLFQKLLLVIQMACAFCMAIGYHSTLNTVLSWYLHISQQIRNPLVLHNGDVYIRCYLFFSMFLPLGKVWSVDAWLKGKPKKQRTYLANVCTIALLIMLAIVYVASFIHKWENAWQVWFVKGDATYYALNLRFFRRPLGDLILGMGRPVVWLMGQAVLYFEFFGPLFLFSPWNHTFSRMFAAFGIAALHMGFGFSMRLDVFYMTGIACPMATLPAWFWDSALPSLFRRFDRRRVFLAAGTLWHDKRSATLAAFFTHMGAHLALKTRYVDAEAGDLESPAGRPGLTSQVWLRYVNEETGQESLNLNAVAECCRASFLLWPAYWLLTFPQVWQLCDTALQIHSRAGFDATRVVAPRRKARRTPLSRSVGKWAKNLAALFFIWFCLAWNGGNLGFNSFPQSVRWVGLTTHLYQSWNMFCPPPTQDWHHRVIGTLMNNQTVDLMSNHGFIEWRVQNFTGFKPMPDLPTLYATNRWHKLWEGVTFGRPWNDMMKVEVGRYVCREWNMRHPKATGLTLMKHEFHLLTTPTRLDGVVEEWRDEVIHYHSCF